MKAVDLAIQDELAALHRWREVRSDPSSTVDKIIVAETEWANAMAKVTRRKEKSSHPLDAERGYWQARDWRKDLAPIELARIKPDEAERLDRYYRDPNCVDPHLWPRHMT